MALKLLRSEFAATPAGRAAFRAEALCTLRVKSPYLAAVVAIGVDDAADAHEPWIAYELVEGVTLRDHVDTDGPLRPALVVHVGVGALEGLRAVHRAGLAHRDVSPANIMMSAQGGGSSHPYGVRLLDLGLAGIIAESAAQGVAGVAAAHGNPHFVSPEQARGAASGVPGDLYQLGATLYFALEGRPPFAGRSVEELLRAHEVAPVPAVSALSGEAGAAWSAFFARAMAKEPRARFGSADAMLVALRRLPVTAARHSTLEPSILSRPRPPQSRVVRPHTATMLLPAHAPTRPLAAAVGGASAVTVRLPLPRLGSSTSAAGVGRRSRAAGGWRSSGGFSTKRAGRAVAGLTLLTSVLLAGAAASSWLPAVSDDDSAVHGSGQVAPAAPDAVVAAGSPASPEVPAAAGAVDAGAGVEEPSADAVESASGPQIVPDIVGRPLTDARAALESAGLLVGSVETAHSSQVAGTVIAAQVAAGAEVPTGSAIMITVATGSNLVPDVEGLDAELAVAILARAGFVAEVSFVETGTLLDGRVVGEAPLRGTVLRLGSIVVLTVGALGDEPSAGA